MVWLLSMNQPNKMKESNDRVTYTIKTSLEFYPSIVIILLCCCILNTSIVFAEKRVGGNSSNRDDDMCPNCRIDRETSRQVAEEVIKETILSRLGFSDGYPNVSTFFRPSDLTIYELYLNNSHPRIRHEEYMQNDQGIIGAGSNVDDVRTPYIWLPASEGTGRPRDKVLLFILDNKAQLIVKHVSIGLYQKPNNNPSRVVKITVFRVTPGKAHQEMASHEHTLTEGSQWVEFDLKSVAKYFNNDDNPNSINLTIKAFYLHVNSTEETPLVTGFKKCDNRKSQNIEQDCNIPYLVLHTEESDRKRNKRSAATECNSESPIEGCCRYPLVVDFEKFQWDFIIAPKNYQANHCYGKCDFLSNQKYPHTHLMTLSANSTNRRVSPCCGPRSMASLSMLYFNKQGNIVFGVLPGMIVERCGCQ